MKGWIIYKNASNEVRPETFELQRLLEEAEKHQMEVRVFSPEQFELIVTRDDRKSVMVDGEVLQLPDFVLPRMGAGTNYFGLALIRHLERLGVKTFNSSQSIETVKDKMYTLQILAEHNLPVPKTMLIRSKVDVELVDKHLGFPIVVKTISGSQGCGVFLAETKNNFIDLLEMISAYKEDATMILQEFVETSRGKDLRVLTIGGRAVAAMKRHSGSDSFKANFSRGGSVEPYEITPEIEWLALETARILNLDIAGIDLLFDGDHYKICEANSSPGFEGLESCCNVNIAEEIYNFLRVRIHRYD